MATKELFKGNSFKQRIAFFVLLALVVILFARSFEKKKDPSAIYDFSKIERHHVVIKHLLERVKEQREENYALRNRLDLLTEANRELVDYLLEHTPEGVSQYDLRKIKDKLE